MSKWLCPKPFIHMKICPPQGSFSSKPNSLSHQAFSTRTRPRPRHKVTRKWSISHPTLLRRLTDRVSDYVIIFRYFICVHGLKKRPCHLVALRETNEHIVNEAHATTMITTDWHFFRMQYLTNSWVSPLKIKFPYMFSEGGNEEFQRVNSYCSHQNHYKFPINLLDYVVELVGFLTRLPTHSH